MRSTRTTMKIDTSAKALIRGRAKLTGAPTLASIVQNKIAADIASGVFKPGMHLEENELVGRYKVSRTPIREALRELASLGTVEAKARRGMLVAAQDGSRLIKTLEVLADLEGSCARYAAERMGDVQRRQLQELHQEIGETVRKGDRARFDEENLELHLLIHAGAENEILAEAVGQMRRRILPYTRAEFISRQEQLSVSHAEHQTIVGAIGLRQGELAYHVTRAHVMKAGLIPEDLMIPHNKKKRAL
ncbi:MAG TPA: GntR family transcriptional regulator [Steroidobacteraceae bacterium]|jgi:DNA-binding GntR family transcriptional regulator|nr:GntR family transcriptional regulator [Steroidobacteraceae bacterium]